MIRLFTTASTLAFALVAAPAFAQVQDAPPGDNPAAPPQDLPTAAPAGDRPLTIISPYVELDQIVTASSNSDDVLTYTSAVAGVDASIQTRRVAVQISYAYEHDFSWQKGVPDTDFHTGLARADVQLTPSLSFEAGALATRTRTDIRGLGGTNSYGDARNVSQLYALYAGPTFATNAGPVSLSAAYRIGYTKADQPYGGFGLPTGTQPFDYFDDATTQIATASASVRSGVYAPFGMTLSGGWERDEAGQLNQRYDGRYARFDVVQPVSPTLALTAGVGYENIEVSSRGYLLQANGAPVLGSDGRYVTDDRLPRHIDYDFDGLYWDAGVLWRPSPRTELQAHVGERYGTFSFAGLLSYQASLDSSLQVAVYDSQQTFAKQLQERLRGLPTQFVAVRDRFSQQYNGCVFGADGQAGGCLDAVFQSLTGASYRARGIDAVYSVSRGPETVGLGAGYANRSLHTGYVAPGVTLYGIEDQSVYAQAFYSRILGPTSNFDLNTFVDWYDSGLRGAPSLFSTGAVGAYSRSFGRLGATASLGVYTFDQDGYANDVSGQALLGMRYQF